MEQEEKVIDLPLWRVEVTANWEDGEHAETYIVPAYCERIATAIAQAKIMSNIGFATAYMLNEGHIDTRSERIERKEKS